MSTVGEANLINILLELLSQSSLSDILRANADSNRKSSSLKSNTSAQQRFPSLLEAVTGRDWETMLKCALVADKGRETEPTSQAVSIYIFQTTSQGRTSLRLLLESCVVVIRGLDGWAHLASGGIT
jgi:hypothetical protein